MGPDGPVMGHWSISFEEDSFSWQYSDIGEEGSYNWSGSSVKMTHGSNEIEASFDAESGVLLLEDVEYVEQDDEEAPVIEEESEGVEEGSEGSESSEEGSEEDEGTEGE